MSIQLHKCAHFEFCIKKHTKLCVDLDACKQLFVLNSYKSMIKKPEVKKNHKSIANLQALHLKYFRKSNCSLTPLETQ